MARDRILIVEDEETLRYCMAERLRDGGLDVVDCATGGAGLEALSSWRFGAMILDLKLPDLDGLCMLKDALQIEPDLSVVILTAHGTVPRAVEAMRIGAFDLRLKPIGLDELALVAARALETTRMRRDISITRAQDTSLPGTGDLVYASERMRAIDDMLKKLGQTDCATVLLLGESGTGKGAVAQALHRSSRRADRPFVSITCTAIPEALLESELFGHECGAFTGALAAKRGLLELADGGTALLDEIGDMTPALQAKLLRFIEERSFRRVGGTRDISIDVRLVAATNRDLESDVAAGRFRADLYYRIKVVTIVVPPLRARPEDVAPLAALFVGRLARELNRNVRDVEPAALNALRAYSWPGNVRELRNAIERAVLFCSGERLTRADFDLKEKIESSVAPDAGANAQFRLTRAGVDLKALEASIVRQALEIAGGNYAAAGRLLNLTREQVKYRADKLALTPGSRTPDGVAPGERE